MKNKGRNTSIIALIMAVCGVGLTVALIFGQIDKETFALSMVSVATFGSSLIGYFAKDANKSHTTDGSK